MENSVVVVTSDHGENIGDHGHIRHVFSLYNTTVRIPLLIRLPGDQRAGEVRPQPVSLIDLFTSLLRIAGAKPPSDQDTGRDLLEENGLSDDVPVFAEYYYPLQALGRFAPGTLKDHRETLKPHLRQLRSVELGGVRLIWGSDGRHELYDLRADPAEKINRFGAPELAKEQQHLLELIAEVAEGAPTGAQGVDLDRPLPAFENLEPEEREMLRALGYVY
jgi:arylsulfatase A-like enzyme